MPKLSLHSDDAFCFLVQRLREGLDAYNNNQPTFNVWCRTWSVGICVTLVT